MSELELFEAYMKKEHPYINVNSEAYAAMHNLWQARVPEGYVVVPMEPTQDQIEYGSRCGSASVSRIYRVMVLAELEK